VRGFGETGHIGPNFGQNSRSRECLNPRNTHQEAHFLFKRGQALLNLLLQLLQFLL
jgi:hypothetical protein